MDQAGNIARRIQRVECEHVPADQVCRPIGGDPINTLAQGEATHSPEPEVRADGKSLGRLQRADRRSRSTTARSGTRRSITRRAAIQLATRIGSFKLPAAAELHRRRRRDRHRRLRRHQPSQRDADTAFTATPTPTPTATMRQRRRRHCTSPTPGGELIVNGGFEGKRRVRGSVQVRDSSTRQRQLSARRHGLIYYGVNNNVDRPGLPDGLDTGERDRHLTFWLNVTSSETTTAIAV